MNAKSMHGALIGKIGANTLHETETSIMSQGILRLTGPVLSEFASEHGSGATMPLSELALELVTSAFTGLPSHFNELGH